ncbi:MAG: DUF58 domain-containing protein [Bacteroidia bacterium]|nr:DUF58 domain-containing protein [Bacteroidia bacterium]
MLKKIKEIFKQFRLSAMFYNVALAIIVLFIFSFLLYCLYLPTLILFYITLFAVLADALLLFRNEQPLSASRSAKFQRLSNGDVNEIYLEVNNYYAFNIKLQIIDELPEQFQLRDFLIKTNLKAGEQKTFSYQIRPVERGEYHFGSINLFVQSALGMVERHLTTGQNYMMPSYPSFIKLRQFELMAISNRLLDAGIKKIRKVGRSTEFEQIKEYVAGDDIRTINWKATARRDQLMVNHYQDERAQNVYSVIDMGRIMRMPFEGMTLLDYSINATLVMGHVAWIKQDKPGLLCFSDKVNMLVNADRKGNQLLRLQEALYNAKTGFGESSYESLLSHVTTKITQRSLIMLYTNFETLNGLKRQLKYIRKIATRHLVVVVFFENTELKELLETPPKDTFRIYEQTIAQKFDYEKRQISRELQKYGILSVYTAPDQLTVNTINKYLEIKTRGLI